MARKVLISFLGTTTYKECVYYDNEMNTGVVKFIQHGLVKIYCKDWKEEDVVLIFLTKDAKEKNWSELEISLQHLNYLVSIKPVFDIKEGSDEKELWNIFQKIYSELKINDEIIIDITHSFRSLPMLGMVLSDYSRFLLNTNVVKVCYGAFEKLGSAHNIHERIPNAEDRKVPIVDLTSLIQLQRWTNNANIFLNTGNAQSLANQITSQQYQEIKENLLKFSQNHLVNRGQDIYQGYEMVKLKELLSNPIVDEDSGFSALKPILNKIKIEFEYYENDSVYNGFLSVRWCIKNGLFQQAATLLEEFITTFVMIEVGETEINNSEKRTTISAALSIGNEELFKFTEVPKEEQIDGLKITRESIIQKSNFKEWQEGAVRKVREQEHKRKLGELSSKIKNSIRNDMNHAGFSKDPRSYSDFEESLVKRYNETRKLIKKIKNRELPELN